MNFSNEYKQEIQQLLPPELVVNLNHPAIVKLLSKVKKKISERSYINAEYEVNMAAIGAKPFIYLPAELENRALLEVNDIKEIYSQFLEQVIFPQAANYTAHVLTILSGDGDVSKLDKDLIRSLEQEFKGPNELIQRAKVITDTVPVPKPPQYVSPKAASEAMTRIEKIRPKPRQTDHDPYKEII